jgi:cysteine sulfinate desulfinase/cysteine desulfurase-like protein
VKKNGKIHIITTAIDHNATLEPIRKLEKECFSVYYVLPTVSGAVKVKDIMAKIIDKTLYKYLVTYMEQSLHLTMIIIDNQHFSCISRSRIHYFTR